MARKLSLEAFEERLVPAAVVRFTEVDGDRITVRTSKGTVNDLENALAIQDGATGVTTIALDLRYFPEAFAGTNVSITAAGKGNKLADRVTIDAFDSNGVGTGVGIDLGVVSVKGSLDYIDVGDSDPGTPAIKKLRVSQWLSGNVSFVAGGIGAVVVKGAFEGSIVSVGFDDNLPNYESPDGLRIGSFTCKTLGGAGGNNSGYLQVLEIGTLTVKETFTGRGSFTNNGLVQAVFLGKTRIDSWAGEARIELG